MKARRHRTLPLLVATVLGVFLASCSSPGPTGSDRAARKSMANVKGGLEAYHDDNGSWPSSLSTLKSYAAKRGRPLDLSPFSKVSVSRRTSATVLVEFTTIPPESKSGGFALTRIDVP